MNYDGIDNPGKASNEDLLRFLDAGPKVLRWPKSAELDGRRSSAERSGATPQCPTRGSYAELAAGTIRGDKADKLLTHAVECSECGDLLAASLNVLDGNPSAEEAAAIAELAASRGDWQKRLVRELAATPMRPRPALPRFRWWMAGSAAAALMLLAAGLAIWQRNAHAPDRQLAMAYEQSRTLELRVPEADFAALSGGGHTRGGAGDREPAPLLEARAKLTRELANSPQNAHWLELEARADVLEEKYDLAIDTLDRLLAQGPVTAELLTDAASAYYQRGLVGGSVLDRSMALDYLLRADKLAPADPVILFNEAIVMENRGQMMNAAEVWNRYLMVERDPKWAAEGRRKLASLEQTLNRLKSHQGRIDRMLSTPRTMDALAGNGQMLAGLDEELATYDLDRLIAAAYPVNAEEAGHPGQARGSPCSGPGLESCVAARRLLQAIGSSLEIKHRDPWLSDLISPATSPDNDSMAVPVAAHYAAAMRLLGVALRQDLTGLPIVAKDRALRARTLFHQMQRGADGRVLAAAEAGEARAETEYTFALSRNVEYPLCRAEGLRWPGRDAAGGRYPWMDAAEVASEMSCDDSAQTRAEGQMQLSRGLETAESHRYGVLVTRLQMADADWAQNAGDDEKSEKILLETLHKLMGGDPPTLRLLGTMARLHYCEEGSVRARTWESDLREIVQWSAILNDHDETAKLRMDLARAELHIGAMGEAERQMEMAQAEGAAATENKTIGPNLGEGEILLASSLLERGDLKAASGYLDRAAVYMSTYGDNWLLRTYAGVHGQLALAQGRLEEASGTLEAAIRASEGRILPAGAHGNKDGSEDRITAADYARQDHDLYAELAATWLAQGRGPESVLALWERFRLRSRGLAFAQCRNGALDCDQLRLSEARTELGNDLLIGQIVLLDRVLLYRVDRNGVVWSQHRLQRQDALDQAESLGRAISTPTTSTEAAESLGTKLGGALLPQLPADFDTGATLFIEPDPLLENLSWAALPTPAGALGLHYPIAEMRSILETVPERKATVETMCRRPVIVGASVTGGDEPPLPEAMVEAMTVSRLLKAAAPLVGKDATTAGVAKTLSTATIFHFAGHAEQTRNGTELLLAPTEHGEKSPWIDSEFLRAHPPKVCRLAVLSACATGTQAGSWNDPLQSMVETLSNLGVPEVVATRWEIDSTATVPFMDSFYHSLAGGQSVAMALTSARRVQSSQTPYRHPYYWAAYYVTGEAPRHLEKELHAKL